MVGKSIHNLVNLDTFKRIKIYKIFLLRDIDNAGLYDIVYIGLCFEKLMHGLTVTYQRDVTTTTRVFDTLKKIQANKKQVMDNSRGHYCRCYVDDCKLQIKR